jgi:hypothetical protein
MLPLILLLCLMPAGVGQTRKLTSVELENVFALPRYPIIPARAFINANFDIDADSEGNCEKHQGNFIRCENKII